MTTEPSFTIATRKQIPDAVKRQIIQDIRDALMHIARERGLVPVSLEEWLSDQKAQEIK